MNGNLSFNILQSLVTVLALVSSLTMVVVVTIWTNIYAKIFHTVGEVWSALLYEVQVNYPQEWDKIKCASLSVKEKTVQKLFEEKEGIPSLLLKDLNGLRKTRWVGRFWLAITIVFGVLITILILTLYYMLRMGLGSEISNYLIMLLVGASICGLVFLFVIVLLFWVLRGKTNYAFGIMGKVSQHLRLYRAKKR